MIDGTIIGDLARAVHRIRQFLGFGTGATEPGSAPATSA
jgi:hypothetical protein